MAWGKVKVRSFATHLTDEKRNKERGMKDEIDGIR